MFIFLGLIELIALSMSVIVRIEGWLFQPWVYSARVLWIINNPSVFNNININHFQGKLWCLYLFSQAFSTLKHPAKHGVIGSIGSLITTGEILHWRLALIGFPRRYVSKVWIVLNLIALHKVRVFPPIDSINLNLVIPIGVQQVLINSIEIIKEQSTILAAWREPFDEDMLTTWEEIIKLLTIGDVWHFSLSVPIRCKSRLMLLLRWSHDVLNILRLDKQTKR